jgi:hypothetical protein
MMLGVAVLTERKTWRRPRSPGRAKRSCDITREEQENVRRALRFLAQRMGDWRKLADAMGTSKATVYAAAKGRAVSAGMAIRAARVAWEPVENVLSGAWPCAGTCPICGRA